MKEVIQAVTSLFELIDGLNYTLQRATEELKKARDVERKLKAEAERNQLLTLHQAMAYLGVSHETLLHYRLLGLEYYKKGRGVWFRKRDIDAWLEEGRVNRHRR